MTVEKRTDLQEDSLLRDLYQFRLYFSSRDARQARAAAWIHAVDVWGQVELMDLAGTAERTLIKSGTASEAIQSRPPATRTPTAAALDEGLPDADRLRLVTRDDVVLTGYPLFEQLSRSQRLLWPFRLLTWLPGFASAAAGRYPGTRERRKDMLRTAPSHSPSGEAAITGVKRAHG